MDTITTFGAAFVVTLLLMLYWYRSPKSNIPPGSRGLPLLGNTLSVLKRNDLIGYVEDRRKQYGDIFTDWLGTMMVVCVSGYRNVTEAFVTNGDICSGRNITAGDAASGGYGIMNQDGEPWKRIRRYTIKALRDLGVGKKRMEDKIVEEAEYFVAEIDEFSGKVWNGTKMVCNMATSNVICSVTYGARFEYTDPVFKELLQKVIDATVAMDSESIFDLLPSSMVFLRPKFIETPFSRLEKAANAFTQEQIDQHRNTYDANNIRDYVDYYIKVTSEGSEKVNEKDIFASIIDMFIAGTGTSATTLDWAILYMTEYPDIQTTCQQELDAEVGRNRAIRPEDKKRLPFVEATMLEIMRLAAIVPLIDHRATEDFKLCGYDIPKDAMVVANLYSVMRDPEYWEEPDQFNPRRFLSADGKILKHSAMIPFSTGSRVCIGEALAHSEIFLFFANLLQHFRFSKVNGDDEDYLSQYACPSSIRGAVNYQTHVTRRD